MNVEVLNTGKEDMEFKLDNPTIAEVLRIYLQKQGVKFAAWRKEHPTKPTIMKVQTSGMTPKKAVSSAAQEIKKDAEKIAALVKKK